MIDLDDRLAAARSWDTGPPPLGAVAERRRLRRRHRRLAVGAAAVAVVAGVAGVALVAAVLPDAEPTTDVATEGAADAGIAVVELPALPEVDADSTEVHRIDGATVVLTVVRHDGVPVVARTLVHRDGADRWQEVDTPFEPRSRAAVVPTPGGLFLWGGVDEARGHPPEGAAYPPAGYLLSTDELRWDRIPDAPVAPRQDAAAAWSGSEVVVVGGARADGPPGDPIGAPTSVATPDAAAYDPVAGAWRTLGPPVAPGGAALTAVVPLDGGVLGSGTAGAFVLRADGGSWEPVDLPTDGPAIARGSVADPVVVAVVDHDRGHRALVEASSAGEAWRLPFELPASCRGVAQPVALGARVGVLRTCTGELLLVEGAPDDPRFTTVPLPVTAPAARPTEHGIVVHDVGSTTPRMVLVTSG